jgi:indole-3-glycerol phosphate synthase
MDRLRKILEVKEREVARLLPRLEHLRAAALQRDDIRPLASALDLRGRLIGMGAEQDAVARCEEAGEPGGLALIAEVKKASPSAGVIAEDFDPVAIATAYAAAGAHAISVLTDEQFFQGHLRYLKEVRDAVTIPVLRKDFTIHEVQIFEAAVAGADAILLIVAALDDATLRRLFAAADTCQLDAVVEVHNFEEMDRAIDLGARIIGINNRDLATFQVDLGTTERLSEEAPPEVILISESGLKTREDTQRVADCGCDAILVGEALMRSGDIAGSVAELLGEV